MICYKPFFATNFRSGNSYAGTDWVFPHAFKGTFYSVSASGTGGVGDWARSHIYLHDETRTSARCPIWVASKLNDTTSGFTQLSVLAVGFWR